MLTPIDIQNHSLKTAVRGYSKKETDDFLEEIIKSYEEVYRENRELKDKLSSLSDGIQYYKGMESTLQKALVLAEKTSTETQEAAKSKADALTSEAETKAEALVKEAKAKAESIEAEANAYAEVEKSKANQELEETRNHVRKLVQSYENYRLQFKKLAESQIEMLDSEHFSIFAPELNEMLGENAPNADEAMEAEETVAINSGISSRESSREESAENGIEQAKEESIATAFQENGEENADTAVSNGDNRETNLASENMKMAEPRETEAVSEGMEMAEPQEIEAVSEGMETAEPRETEAAPEGMETVESRETGAAPEGMETLEPRETGTAPEGMKTVIPQAGFQENGVPLKSIIPQRDEIRAKREGTLEDARKSSERSGEDSPFEFIDTE